MSASSTAADGGHLSVDTLLAWWLHETDAATTEAVDAHLLACDACGEALDGLVALGDGVRAAFKAGLVGAVTTGPFVDRLVGQGVRVREYRLSHNGGVDCTVSPDDELLVAHLAVPSLAGVERLDAVLEISLEPGVERRVEDLPFDDGATEVIYLPNLSRVKASPANVHVVRLVAVAGGVDAELGRYEFRHRPWGEAERR
jgi:hypothetical protein